MRNWDGKGNRLDTIRIPDGDGYTDFNTNHPQAKIGELTFVLFSS